MTPSLSHRHYIDSQQDYDPRESDITQSTFQETYKDFDLFDNLGDEPTSLSTKLAGPLDLSFLDSFRGDIFPTSRQSTPYDGSFSPLTDLQSTHGSFSPNPRLRAIQQATTGAISASSTPPPMHEGGSWGQTLWPNTQDNAYLSPRSTQSLNTPPQTFRGHKRLPSESSIGSTGPDSPYTQTSAYPQIVDPDTHSNPSPRLEAFDTSYPQQLDKFFYYNQQPASLTPQSAQTSFQNLQISEDPYGMMGGRQGARAGGSISSPNAQDYGVAHAERRRAAQAGYNGLNGSTNATVPKFERTTTDAFTDTLMDPAASAPSSTLAQSQQNQQNQHVGQYHHLSPHHNTVFSAMRQQADNARSQSPATVPFYERSPFSNYSSEHQLGGPMPSQAGNTGNPRMGAAGSIRARGGGLQAAGHGRVPPNQHHHHQQQQQQQPQQQQHPHHHATQQHHHHHHHPNPYPNAAGAGASPSATISPKEAVLDSSATLDAKHGANPSTPQAIKRESGFSSAHAVGQSQFVTNYTSGNGLTDLNSAARATHHDLSSAQLNTPKFPSSSQESTSSSQQSGYPLMAPNNVATPNQAYPFISQSRRQSSSMRSGDSEVPQFPASLTSMESTKSESSREPNVRPPGFRTQDTIASQRSDVSPPLSRPADTSANTGAYQCAAAGCSARFDTNAKLKKHRREDHADPHKSPTPGTPQSISSHTRSTAAATNQSTASNSSSNNAAASRNNATGPFRCERINPGTGRPCNTIFSRSYDLTRHEETIHNNNKKKSKCQICTEEKTFSRHDALTRHMRVVHPDVDFPGRNSRRR